MIYEGANGVQALDLVGRKLGAGRRPNTCMGFFEDGQGEFCKENAVLTKRSRAPFTRAA